MKISKVVEKKEVQIGDITVKLRQFPYGEIRFERGAADPIQIEKAMFLYCIEDWSGIVDLDTGEAFECNEVNKLHVFNYEHTFRQDILLEINSLMSDRMEKIKNSLRSQNGKETEPSSSAPTATKST